MSARKYVCVRELPGDGNPVEVRGWYESGRPKAEMGRVEWGEGGFEGGGRLLGMRSVHQPRGFKYEARKGTKEETTPSLPYQ